MTSLPEKIGKYQIKSILGQGGMGVVYRATDPDILQEVALKVIRPELLKDDDGTFIKRFRNEVLACRRLKHPNIVATYDYHEDGDYCYIVMEFIDGQPLADYLDDNQVFELSKIHKIINQLLTVLSYAHGQGVVHRDIKPDNIMVKDDGTIHIMDFGIARMNTSTLTVAGTVMGSPGYMSPEQCMGQQVDNRSDLFSVGVVLYQLLANEKPFTGETPMVTMQKILNVEPANVSLLNVSVPSTFDAIINKALAKSPKHRYQSAEEFSEDLDKFFANTKSSSVEGSSGSKKGAYITAGMAVIALSVAGYVFRDKFSSGTDVAEPETDKVIATISSGKGAEPESILKKPTIQGQLEQLKVDLKSFDCNTLQATLDPNNKFNISGTVQSSDLSNLDSLLNQQLSEVGYTSTVSALGKPFCEVVSALGLGVELNQATGSELDVQPYSHGSTYVEGELIMFEMITPTDNAFIYVDYFTSDGNVVHLYPSSSVENQAISGPSSFVLGDKDVKWEVIEPFGTDLITIISYPKALFNPLRPNVENTADYLSTLKKVLSEPAKKKFAKADYFFLTTQAK